jgi:hypothetical protein
LFNFHYAKPISILRSFSFPTFPAEIVLNIFNSIDGEDFQDCFSLGLTSERCWIIGQSVMKKIFLRFQLAWAGDRIICTGDYLEHGNLPKGLLSTKEENEYAKYATECGSLEEYCHTPVRSYPCVPKERMAYFIDRPCDQLSFYDRQRICSAIDIAYEEPEILRNISKRQYVRRADLLEMSKTCPKDWEFDLVDLGHVVISRICWSSDPSITICYDGDIHRGVWAGDRFDITSVAALEEKDENGQQVLWTDVTKEVLEEMRGIWSSEYGEGVLTFTVLRSSRGNHVPSVLAA